MIWRVDGRRSLLCLFWRYIDASFGGIDAETSAAGKSWHPQGIPRHQTRHVVKTRRPLYVPIDRLPLAPVVIGMLGRRWVYIQYYNFGSQDQHTIFMSTGMSMSLLSGRLKMFFFWQCFSSRETLLGSNIFTFNNISICS